MPYWLGRPLLLIAVGAILTFAVHVYVRYVDLPTAGFALLLVGILDLAVSLWFATAKRRPPRRTVSRTVGWLTDGSSPRERDEVLAPTQSYDRDATEVLRRPDGR